MGRAKTNTISSTVSRTVRGPGEISEFLVPDAEYHVENINEKIGEIYVPELIQSNHNLSIMLDVDATVFPLAEAIQRLPGGERCFLRDCHDWDEMAALCGGDFWKLLSRATRLEAMQEVGLYPGVKAGVDKLKDHGVAIHVLTHRSKSRAEATEQFLRHEGIQSDSFLCDAKADKFEFCATNGVNLIVDDKPDFIEKVQGIDLVSMEWPYNASALNTKGFAGVKNWLDMTDTILKKLANRL